MIFKSIRHLAKMAALSCLKNVGKLKTVGSAVDLFKNASKTKAFNYIPVRMSHGDHTMRILRSTYSYMKTKDLVIFYLMLGAVPLIAIATYVNVFIGPAELALIPEDYEPKHWEYYKHPISRFFARYILPSPQERYERTLHNLFIMGEMSQIKKLKLEVKKKMKERVDYQAWYYEKPTTRYLRKFKEDVEFQNADRSSMGGTIRE